MDMFFPLWHRLVITYIAVHLGIIIEEIAVYMYVAVLVKQRQEYEFKTNKRNQTYVSRAL